MRMRGKETDRCCGLMAACTKVNGAKAYSTDWVEWSSQIAPSRRAILRITSLSIRLREILESTLWAASEEPILLSSTRWGQRMPALASKVTPWTTWTRIPTNWTSWASPLLTRASTRILLTRWTKSQHWAITTCQTSQNQRANQRVAQATQTQCNSLIFKGNE